MSTYEDRLAALERKVATMQVERIYEQKKMEETTPSDRSFKEINYNLTMLLGIASGQEQAIGKVTNGLRSLETSVNSRFEEVNGRLDSLEGRFDSLETSVNSRFEEVNSRFDSLETSVNGRFKAQDEKLDQILLLLNKFTSNLEQEK